MSHVQDDTTDYSELSDSEGQFDNLKLKPSYTSTDHKDVNTSFP